MKRVLIVSILFVVGNVYASTITLGTTDISEKDQTDARELRDNTKAPNSLIGGVGEYIGKTVSEVSAKHSQSCKSGAADWINVDFDVVAGFSSEGVDRVFSMSPLDKSTGTIEQNASKNGVSIYRASNQTLAGYYIWNAHWDKNRKWCSGKIYISGQKCNASIKVYSDCRSAGYSEF
ncbi:hypothetical protein HGA64_04775 [Candidatus Falkowbacteria bacterium]|nr:hypothetical protein [Candidatus Falkowbacteria bacterium]